MGEKNDKNPAVLIVGDWLVDEYWFLVRHHSEISSHTGFSHYRLASKKGDIISDLCGAGHVARIFYELNFSNKKRYQIYGLGNWNENDQVFISHLVHNRKKDDCYAASASFGLFPNWCEDKPDITLNTLNPKGSTTRVIRQYHQKEKGLEQINRVDWEADKAAEKIQDISLDDHNLPTKTQLQAIVIHDLMKGVVTNSLIKQLIEKYPNVPWYVRSKNIEPEWLSLIKDSIELLLIGPEIAALLSPWECWLINGRIGKQALETIQSLPGKNVVLLSDSREVIVRHGTKKVECTTALLSEIPSQIYQLGWPSAIFSSLVFEMFKSKKQLNRANIENAISIAEKLDGVIPPKSSLVNFEKKKPTIDTNVIKIEKEKWDHSMQACGIINEKSDPYVEVWRGSPNLPGYITCIKKKEDQLKTIARGLRAFIKNENPVRSLSIIVQADPGSGKTFLAKCFAKSFGFSFIRFDVTQMTHRDELIDLFESVASLQANTNNKVLVFVDEINALLDGTQAYGAFLTPLEDGVYMRRGRYFSLRPSVWFFAGTKLDADKLKKGEKLSDFKSRMSIMENIDFESLTKHYTDSGSEKLQNEARLEQVYLGATMIRNHFSDIQFVSKEVLRQFYKMDPAKAPARKIRKMAGSLRNVQYGRVTKENFDNWKKIEWDDKDENKGKLVKLIF
jgi:hypothetical protein